MNTQQLQDHLHSCPLTRRGCVGVYAADRLPRRIKKFPAFIIANTDKSSDPGMHWVAFYFPTKNSRGEFFDSYGRPPGYYSPHFLHFLKRNCKTWVTNKKVVQAAYSMACGPHCLFYLKLRAGGKSMKTITKAYYSNNLYNNDKNVEFHVSVTPLVCSKACTTVQSCIPFVN
jgi:hypothetical protein